MALIHGANTLAAAGGYSVANSCRFNSDGYMHKTPSSGGNRRTFTISCWFKMGLDGSSARTLFEAGSGNNNSITLAINNHRMYFMMYSNDGSNYDLFIEPNILFHDHSAWYHVCIAVDTTQGTDTNRVKWYHNGVQVTTTNMSFQTNTLPDQNLDTYVNHTNVHAVGQSEAVNADNEWDGYIAEFVLIDGTQYAPTSFGEFDEDSPNIWKPIDVSELTFGTNGFYLDFEASGNLGNDANGGTDLTEVSLAAADQAVDTPTNNFCVMNPLDNKYQGHTFSEGNCKIVTQANNTYTFSSGTFGLSSGKWYAECKLAASGGYADIGIADGVSTGKVDSLGGDANEYAKHDFTSNVTAQGSGVANGAALSVGNVCGVFLDLDNSKLYFSINGSLQNTTGIGITAAASTTNGNYFFGGGDEDGGSAVTLEWNFGGCSAFAISSAVTDDNGYGNFEYTPTVTVESTSTKFYAVCTKNIAEYG